MSSTAAPPTSLAAHWGALAAAGLLGTDRHPLPPPPDGAAAELADARRAADAGDAALDQIALLGALRRGGVKPDRPVDGLLLAADDRRPICPPAAAVRMAELLEVWPELVDDWLDALELAGWRLAPELTVDLLSRWRGDPPRRARAIAAAGPVAMWLIELFPASLAAKSTAAAAAAPHRLALPDEFAELLTLDQSAFAETLARRLEAGSLANRHRPLLLTLLRMVPPSWLPATAARLDRAGTNPATIGLALGLAAFAADRQAMLEELRR